MFDSFMAQKPFDQNILSGKIIRWIIKNDLPFSMVDNEDFADIFNYLKTESGLKSRKTLMSRMTELYGTTKTALCKPMETTTSKIPITCDMWTSKNGLSFFGITGHWIDNNYVIQSFKFVEGEHDGKNLANELIAILEELGIIDKLMCITGDNASNNTTMIEDMEKIYWRKKPSAEFTLVWNKIECITHVINLAAQALFKNFKQQLDSDTYIENNSDAMLSRLSFLVHKIRLLPKMKRTMKSLCEEMDKTFLVNLIIYS
jgi:hypothetical protein